MISRERIDAEIGLMSGRIKSGLRNGKAGLGGFQTGLSERTRRAARKTDYYVHDHAWKMIAAGAGLAFAAGWLLGRGKQPGRGPEAGGTAGQRPGAWELAQGALPLALILWKTLRAKRSGPGAG